MMGRIVSPGKSQKQASGRNGLVLSSGDEGRVFRLGCLVLRIPRPRGVGYEITTVCTIKEAVRGWT